MNNITNSINRYAYKIKNSFVLVLIAFAKLNKSKKYVYIKTFLYSKYRVGFRRIKRFFLSNNSNAKLKYENIFL